MPRLVLELLNSWGPAIGCGRAKEAWRLAPLCLLWCIWRERNTLYIWIASHHNLNVFTYVDFLKLFSVRPF